LAEEVLYTHGLSRIVFVPCYTPPHKAASNVSSAADRLVMTRQACEGNAYFTVSDVEISRQGPSYTVNTLENFPRQGDREIYFILGTDSLREIHTWKEYLRLFGLSHFIVVSRPGTDFRGAWSAVPGELRESFVDRGDHFVHSGSKLLIPSPVRGLDISATQVRNLVNTGRSIRYLVPEPVRRHIEKNNLYRNRAIP